MTSWVLILITSTLTIVQHPGSMTVDTNVTNAEVSGHFTSKADCMGIQAAADKYDLFAHPKDIVKGNTITHIGSTTVCMIDPK